MSTAMNSYAARVQDVLRQTTAAATSKLPTVSFVDTSSATGFATTVIPYIIYALITVFVILLILVIVHYTITPIFNFGDAPTALINLASTAEWDKSWTDSKLVYTDTISSATVPRAEYSMILDFKVFKSVPSATMKNDFILAYKTPSTTAKAVGAFAFPLTTTTADPSLVITFNALNSKLVVYFLVQNKADTTQKFSDMISAEIRQGVANRLALIVSDNIIELYLNGKYATSKVISGKTIVATDKEYIFASPAAFTDSVRVANLMTTPRVITSGEIVSFGQVALE